MSTIDMARKKNFNRNPQSEAIAKAILENYKPGDNVNEKFTKNVTEIFTSFVNQIYPAIP